MKISFCVIVCVLLSAKHALCWDSEQLEVFDVVDEVKQNFYELMNITQVYYFVYLSKKDFLM